MLIFLHYVYSMTIVMPTFLDVVIDLIDVSLLNINILYDIY